METSFNPLFFLVFSNPLTWIFQLLTGWVMKQQRAPPPLNNQPIGK